MNTNTFRNRLQKIVSLFTSLSLLFNCFGFFGYKNKDKDVNNKKDRECYSFIQANAEKLKESLLANIEREETKVSEETVKNEMTYEEKMLAIIEKYNLTYEQLDTVLAGCVAESCGEGTNYVDAYAVANVVYNRTLSVAFSSNGDNIYDQFVALNQFEVYANGSYETYLGRIDLVGYQAAIEMFYTEEVMHNFLYFRGNACQVNNSITFAEWGNHYYQELQEDDTITSNLTLVRKHK